MALLSAVLLVLAALPGDKKPPVGLRLMDYEAAVTAAKLERRPILMLFCDGDASCRAQATEMLSEVKLRQWLDEKVVAIQVDKRTNLEIADKYRVRKTPTYLFTDSKGTEMDRLVGARDSKTLRTEGEEILKGGDPMERLQKKRKGREQDPEMRLRYADILCDRGDLDAALAEYLAVHAKGGPMGAEAFEEIQRLGRIYPRAADAIGGIAAKLEPRVQSAEATDDEFQSWFDLCRQMRFETRMLAVHDALAHLESSEETEIARRERAAALKARIAPSLRDLFYTDRRYADLGALIQDALADFGKRKERHAEVAARGDAAATKDALRSLRNDTARDYETLVAVKRLGEATLLADALIGADTSIATYDALVDGALRADAKNEARMLAYRGRADARLDARARQGIAPTIPAQPK